MKISKIYQAARMYNANITPNIDVTSSFLTVKKAECHTVSTQDVQYSEWETKENV
jgi:hypothetical protein